MFIMIVSVSLVSYKRNEPADTISPHLISMFTILSEYVPLSSINETPPPYHTNLRFEWPALSCKH